MHANNLKELPTKHLIKLRHLKEHEEKSHTLRVEITIRGWERIHTKSFYEYLDRMEEWIRQADHDLYFVDSVKGSSKIERLFVLKKKHTASMKEIETILYTSLSDIESLEPLADEEWNKYDTVHIDKPA
jgi:hypothetical protein